MDFKALSEKELQLCLNGALYRIDKAFGIRDKLNWPDIAILRHYIRCFAEQKEYNKFPQVATKKALHYFMLEQFGLDTIELGKDRCKSIRHGKLQWIQEGFDFLGGEKFKEYCRQNIDLWREERELGQ